MRDVAGVDARPPAEPQPGASREGAGAGRTRAALFVDFDNIYSGLQQQDVAAAEAFARNPEGWLTWLQNWVPADGSLDAPGGRRSILVRRCYLNPGAFGRFRPYFVKSGFQVVDCPSLTAAGKNGADIQMVMDVLDALEHGTRFDEFILLSGDSDFTPVLLRLRAHDRRTIILAVGFAAAAYRAACDTILTEETFIEQALQVLPAEPASYPYPSRPEPAVRALGPVASDVPRPSAVANATRIESPSSEQRRRDAGELIATLVAQSPSPIASATIAKKVLDRFGSRLGETGWDGAGGFKEFVESLPEPRFSVSWAIPGYFFDPERHQLPPSSPLDLALDIGDSALNELVSRIHQLTDTPRLTSAEFGVVFAAIAEEVNARGYFLTETSRAVRDTCRERGTAVPRQEIAFILKGLVYSGSLKGLVRSEDGTAEGAEPNDPRALAVAFCQNVIRLCERTQLSLSEDELARVRGWITGDVVDAAPEP